MPAVVDDATPKEVLRTRPKDLLTRKPKREDLLLKSSGTSETVTAQARSRIERVWRCSVFDRYGEVEGFGEADRVRLKANMESHAGGVDVRVLEVDEIERTSSGKFRAVICELSDAEKARLRQLA